MTVEGFYVGQSYEGWDGENCQGKLDITDSSAVIKVTGKLVMGIGGELNCAEGSIIHMTGSDFENYSTHPEALAGLIHLMLEFEGGEGVVDTFEVAGLDLGVNPAGLVDNFALGTLKLGGLRLVRRKG